MYSFGYVNRNVFEINSYELTIVLQKLNILNNAGIDF